MDIPARYTTERLLLRPYDAADAPAYYQMLQHNWAHLLEFMPPEMMNAKNALDIEVFFQWQANEWQQGRLFIWGLWNRAGDGHLGEVYLANPDWHVPCIEVGYFLIQSATGQGFATEATRCAVRIAFKHMQVQRVELQCKADNESSTRVAARCGFTLEGRLRQRDHKKDGTRVDRLWFGLLRSEWEQS